MKFLAWWLSFCLAASPASAVGSDDGKGSNEEFQLHPKTFNLSGEPGVWFPAKDALFITERLELSLSMEEKLGVQDRLIENLTKQVEFERAINLEHEAHTTLLKDEIKKLDEELAEADAWYKQPALWLGVGVLLAVLSMFALGQVTPDGVTVVTE